MNIITSNRKKERGIFVVGAISVYIGMWKLGYYWEVGCWWKEWEWAVYLVHICFFSTLFKRWSRTKTRGCAVTFSKARLNIRRYSNVRGMIHLCGFRGILLGGESKLDSLKGILRGSDEQRVPAAFSQRSLLWSREDVAEDGGGSSQLAANASHTCPMYINATESLR